jgi:hypothetical protein
MIDTTDTLPNLLRDAAAFADAVLLATLSPMMADRVHSRALPTVVIVLADAHAHLLITAPDGAMAHVGRDAVCPPDLGAACAAFANAAFDRLSDRSKRLAGTWPLLVVVDLATATASLAVADGQQEPRTLIALVAAPEPVH